MRNYRKDILYATAEVECFCIVPESLEGRTAEDDKTFLKRWANIPVQTHTLNVGVLETPDITFENTDAIVTSLRNTPVGVVTADCVPILLHAPDIGCVAAIHAGWKGTLGGIVDNVLDVMESRGAELSRMEVIFGPSIGKDVYEVDRILGERFAAAGFEEYVSWPDGPGGRPHVDLQGVDMERLTRRGVSVDNIHLSDDCTYSRPDLHSYRRDGDKAGRQLTAIRLR